MTWEVERIGDCTLYRGDCREVLPMLALADAVVTDPPYGVGFKTKTNDYRHSLLYDAGKSLRASILYDDSPERVLALVHEAMALLARLTSRMAVFPGRRLLHDYPKPVSMGCVYSASGAGCDPWGFACFTPILYYGKCPYLAAGMGSRPNAFADIQPNRERIDHPCPKPLRWMIWLVNRVSLEGEAVLDPFMGSGTTGVACVQLGRAFTGIEIEPHYFDLACRRIEEAYRQLSLFPPVVMPPAQQEVLL